MRIFAIAPNPISATNKKQYNQNTFQGKIPKSANVADTFQKSVDKIAEEKRVNQLWNTARLFSYCFFKPVYINQVENLQQKYKDILKIKDKDKFLDKAFNELKNDYGLADIPIELDKNFKRGTKYQELKSAAAMFPYYKEGFIKIGVDKKYSNKRLFTDLAHELRHVLQQLKIYQYGSKSELKKAMFNGFLDAYPNIEKSELSFCKSSLNEHVDAHFEFFKNAGVKRIRRKDEGYSFAQKLIEATNSSTKKSSEAYYSNFVERDAIRTEAFLMHAITGK